MADEAVDRVIDNIADGVAIDWSTVELPSASDADREYVDSLRILGVIADAHRDHADRIEAVAIDAVALLSPDFRGTERFAVERCLGSGAFGTVYQAYDR